ncbi:hypothetical protein KAZ93_05135 [Patescibacteria group bacterium]|nr:hypothetical protein [Patescibacteria group bacterium]
MQTAANEAFTFDAKPHFPDSYLRKRLNGEAINRYFLDDSLTNRLLYVDDKESFDDLD